MKSLQSTNIVLTNPEYSNIATNPEYINVATNPEYINVATNPEYSNVVSNHRYTANIATNISVSVMVPDTNKRITIMYQTVILLSTLFSPSLAQSCPQLCKCGNTTKYFYPLPQLTYDSVSCVNVIPLLSTVPTGLQVSTQILELTYSNISRVTKEGFDNLDELLFLEGLNVGGNKLEHVDSTAFQGLVQLKDLILTQNKLQTIPLAIQNLTSLVSLHLYRNVITSIDANAFYGLDKLKFINLHDNQISYIDENAFANLVDINNIYLTANYLVRLPETIFLHNRKLQYLALGDNKLMNISEKSFRGLTSLQHLDLRQNIIQSLAPDLFKTNTALHELHLEENDITDLNEDIFKYLHDLQILGLTDNPLGLLKRRLFQSCENLQQLRISHVSSIDNQVFQTLDKLQTLVIKNSIIKHINTELFRGLTNTKYLSLKYNQIEIVANNAFCEMKSLDKLYLSFNNIYYLQEHVFANLTNLAQLYLDHNKIAHIDDNTFHGLTQLKYLSLEFNKITHIGEQLILNNGLLETLIISNNNINMIEKNAFERLQSLKKIDASFNPFYCDCEMQWFREWIDQNDYKFSQTSIANTQCEKPEKYRGRRFTNVTIYELQCTFPGISTTENNIVVSLGENLTLPCYLNDDSIATLKWVLPDKFPIHTNEIYPDIRVDGQATLYIINITTRDIGNYTCISNNNIGSENLTITIETMHTTTKETTTISTTQYLTEDDFSDSISTTTSVSPIESCQPNPCQHNGTCRNSIPRCSCTPLYGGLNCEINKPPMPNNVQIIDVTEVSITLSWSLVRGDDILGYYIIYKNNNVEQLISPLIKVNNFTINLLTAGTQYQICVVSLNGAGKSYIDDEQCMVITTEPKQIKNHEKHSNTIITITIVIVITVVVLTTMAIVFVCFKRNKKHKFSVYSKHDDKMEGTVVYESDTGECAMVLENITSIPTY
ncbi:uncharacterized protein LOC144343146 [Saccoglossus kowalevskii]